MLGCGADLEQKQAWMRGRQSAANTPGTPVPASGDFAEQHFTVAQIAESWSLSHDVVRKLFEREPGVLVIGDQGSRSKRRYTTLRIPESVVMRVHRRFSNPDLTGARQRG
jgi:hypothetical protein